MCLFRKLILLIVVGVLLPVFANDLIELNELNYKKLKKTKGIVIVQVNWGRVWKCGDYENAQLQNLSFKKKSDAISLSEWTNFSLNTPSKLFVKDTYLPYAFLLEAGEYLLSEFDVKIAQSQSNIRHYKVPENKMIKDGKSIGGSFTVNKGEVVYIGHFGIDCLEQPIPWRYFISNRDDFKRYVNGFKSKYPFVENKDVQFRLFSTTMFGQPYSL